MLWRLVRVEPTPILQDFRLMQGTPLSDQGQRPAREVAIQYSEGRHPHLSFRVAVLCVEMWRIVIEELHPDHDAEEA